MKGLYAIVDVQSVKSRGLDVIEFGRAVIEARPSAVQLRNKDGSARETFTYLVELAGYANHKGVALFANDRPDLALLAGCSGVHIGQDDIPIEAVRALSKTWKKTIQIGLSTHNEKQLREAITLWPDYIAIGPVFQTTSKLNTEPSLGLEELQRLVHIARNLNPKVRLVAIGGLSSAHASFLAQCGIAAASIGAIIPSAMSASPMNDVQCLVRDFHMALISSLD